MSSSEFVQLSNTLQTSPMMKKSNVCRCLFGRPDRETESNIRRELAKERDEDLGVAKLRWGFDFAGDKPLCNGPYEWTALHVEDVPSFYSETKRVPKSKSRAGRRPSPRLCKPLFSDSEMEDSPVLSFSSERLRGDVESKSSSGRDDSFLSTTLNDVETSNADPVPRDITTPCVKKLNKLDFSEKSTVNKLNSESSPSSCSPVSNGSSNVAESGKAKVQSSIVDFLKVKKRKSSQSLSRSAKSLRRL